MGLIGRIRATVRWGTRLLAWEERRFERRYGVSTRGVIEPSELTVSVGDVAEGFTYVGTPIRVARWWLRALPGDVETFTFVDMGSGKGRVLLLAAEHGFGRSVGIEFAAELHEAAVANARVARSNGLTIEPHLGDAASFEFPLEPLVVHFNNPFSERVMHEVIANLTASYETKPRPVIAIYQQLTHEEPGQATRNIELLDQVPFLSGRTLSPRGLVDRRLLKVFTVRLFESPEVARG
jgi:SAM-dependent methyltransferase